MKLTFVSFALNDDKQEEQRVRLWLNSLFSQDCDEFKILFWDMSARKKAFKLPKHPRLEVIRDELGGQEIFAGCVRNTLSLQVETSLLCHCNADCYYSPNFAKVLIETLEKNPDHLVLCLRRDLTKEQWQTIVDGEKNVPTSLMLLSVTRVLVANVRD